MKLKLDETILRCRRERNLTQEELAAALGVSPQSISNWEHGGYPDIELLPSIANYFGITVDELIGNDRISVEEDIASFPRKYYAVTGEERLNLAVTYHRKYPNNFMIMDMLAGFITYGGFHKTSVYRKLLGEICERIIRECTDVQIRSNAIIYMCEVTDDDEEEFERWASMLPLSYCFTYNEVREKHFRKIKDTASARRLQGRNNLALLTHLGDRAGVAGSDPERAGAYARFQMRVLDACGDNGEVPDGWLGRYAYFRLTYASALFGCGRIEDGFTELDGAVSDYLRSFELPDDVPLTLGSGAVFHGIRCIRHRKKGYFDSFVYEDGTAVDNPVDGYCYFLDPSALYDILTHGDWSASWFDWWFDAVQDDERFLAQVGRVKTYMDNYRK